MSYEKLPHRQRILFGSGETMDYSYRMNALRALREAFRSGGAKNRARPRACLNCSYGSALCKINGLLRFLIK